MNLSFFFFPYTSWADDKSAKKKRTYLKKKKKRNLIRFRVHGGRTDLYDRQRLRGIVGRRHDDTGGEAAAIHGHLVFYAHGFAATPFLRGFQFDAVAFTVVRAAVRLFVPADDVLENAKRSLPKPSCGVVKTKILLKSIRAVF